MIQALRELETRASICQFARSCIGMGSTGSPERQKAYEDMIFPSPEDAKFKAQMADSLWQCGLFARACLLAASVDSPLLTKSYHDHLGAIITWLVEIGEEMKTLYNMKNSLEKEMSPEIDGGDILIVEGPTHVIVITDSLNEIGEFNTAEGGKPEVDYKSGEKGMCIQQGHILIEEDNGLWARVIDIHGSKHTGRKIQYLLSARDLFRSDE